jgi:hypothetical protein
LRHKHELERGDRSFRYQHKVEQGDSERAIGKKSVEGLWNDESDRAYDEVRDRFPGPPLTGHPKVVGDDKREDAGDFGAFGVLPGPLVTGIPEQLNVERKSKQGSSMHLALSMDVLDRYHVKSPQHAVREYPDMRKPSWTNTTNTAPITRRQL